MRRFLLLICLFVFSTRLFAQLPNAVVDVKHYEFNLQLSDANNTIKGVTTVDVRYLKNSETFSLNLVKMNKAGKGMLVSAVKENGQDLKFEQDSNDVVIDAAAKQFETHSYTIVYSGVPADGLIISNNMFGHRTFFGDNWPNRAHNWLPCIDHPADKATVDFIVTAPDHYQVVANGAKVSETKLSSHLKLTHWKESAPLATKVMVIGVADFGIDSTEVQGIPVSSYVFKENQGHGFIDYSVAQEILPYYIKNIGPFAYEKLANVQSKTIFGGMENASAIFYFEKSVGDKGIESLMAHEIAHQWFGDAATEKSWQHLWLSEGFATYMTDMYLEHKYAKTDTLKQLLKAQRTKVINFAKRRFTPVVDTAVTGNYTQLLNANSYEKGGWVLHMLRRRLGDTIFWRSIRSYYAEYRDKNANTDDLRKVFERNSGRNLQTFFKQWLYTAGHPKLKINYEYAEADKTLNIHIEQMQDQLFDIPLEFSVPGLAKIYTFNIREKSTTVKINLSEKPETLNIDPDVNLLFEQVD